MRKKICTHNELFTTKACEFVVTKSSITQDAFIVEYKNDIFAYVNQCPHTGVNLNWVKNQFFNYQGDFLQCSVHGALFDPVNGKCVHGPCVGQALSPVAVELVEGIIYVVNSD